MQKKSKKAIVNVADFDKRAQKIRTQADGIIGVVYWERARKKIGCSTRTSRVVTHHGTIRAITSLTSEIGRDPVLSCMYGRTR